MTTDTIPTMRAVDPSDVLDLEMDAPSAPVKVPGLSPLGNVIVAIRLAKTKTELEQAIIPARSWPEGADKAKARAELRSREDQLKLAALSKVQPVTPPAPRQLATIERAPGWQGSPMQAKVDAWMKPALDRANLNEVMHNVFGSLAAGIQARPHQQRWGAPTAQARPAAVLGRVRTAMPIITAQPATGAGAYVVDADNAYNVRAAVNREAVVIGAREGGSGVLTGWMGLGEMTRGTIEATLIRAGMPGEWAPPAQSAHAHAAAALTELTHQGRILRAERGRKVSGMGIGNFAGMPRNYMARWSVGEPTHGVVGDAMGEIILTAALTTAGSLDLAGNQKLVDQVRAEFLRRSGNEVFPAGFVTDWLRRVLVQRFGAVRLGANWYVPAEHASKAERLCEELAKVWGQGWILPALPVSTTDQLRAGLVRGLAEEARVVLDELEAQRAAAKRDNRADVGPKAAATMLAKLRDVYDRSKGYAGLLGHDMVSQLRGRLADAVAVLEPLCDDTAQRFSMMDLA